MSGTPIRIIGGGIGGAAAALALTRRGHAVTVFERQDAAREVGAGLQLGPNAVKVLRALGVEVAGATRPDAVVLRDGLSGRAVARVPLGETIDRRHGAPYLQMHRADLLDALVAAGRAAGAEFRFGEAVTATDGDWPVTVAADGLRSDAREALNPGVAPRFAGFVAWRALVPGDMMPTGQDTAIFMGPGQHVVTYRVRGGALCNIVAVEESPEPVAEGWGQVTDPARLRAAFAGWSPEVTRVLAAVREVGIWGLHAHPPLARWQNGRTVLLGDACHPMLPFMAQGAAMALEDAWVLASCLDDLRDIPASLARYEALRKPRTTRVQALSRGNARIYHLKPAPLRAALHTGMRLQSRLAPGALLHRFDWLYGADVTQT